MLIFVAFAMPLLGAQQIGTAPLAAGPAALKIEQIAIIGRNSTARVDQLPPPDQLPKIAASREPDTLKPRSQRPLLRIPRPVVSAWLAIKARGEQPSADALVGELGSELVFRMFGTAEIPAEVIAALRAGDERALSAN